MVARFLADQTGAVRRRDAGRVICIWLLLVVITSLMAKQILSVPGLYYDEAVFGGMTKDFLTGHVYGRHMPGNQVTVIFGRPFPVFVQSYLGALKSWMLMPVLGLFGYTVPALRMANLFWGWIALLFLMLGTWSWLGARTALLLGPLVAFDPAFFFISIWDWGAAIPSFVCRGLCFYFAAIWWRNRRPGYAFLAALSAGLGFYNKIDFAVTCLGIGIAAVFCFGGNVRTLLRKHFLAAGLSFAGLLVGAGPMLVKVPQILLYALSEPNLNGPSEFAEKIKTIIAMYDGSYFYRLMSAGGVFEKMFSEPAHAPPIFAVSILIASAASLTIFFRNNANIPNNRAGGFFVVAAVLVTVGVVLLPGAVRIHHAMLVFPLPHLILATVAALGLDRSSKQRTLKILSGVLFLALLFTQWLTILKTQGLIRETGGRGWWSENIDRFCEEYRHRTDVTVVSLDWGFNEQVLFLTDGPRATEPIWAFDTTLKPLPKDPNHIYLVHPAAYSLLGHDQGYLEEARMSQKAEVEPYFDRQNRLTFYTIRFDR